MADLANARRATKNSQKTELFDSVKFTCRDRPVKSCLLVTLDEFLNSALQMALMPGADENSNRDLEFAIFIYIYRPFGFIYAIVCNF